jgi:hypothetical protein
MEERAAEKLRELLAKVALTRPPPKIIWARDFRSMRIWRWNEKCWICGRTSSTRSWRAFYGDTGPARLINENHVSANSINGIRVKASKIWLKSVFRHLLQNAVSYGDKRCTIVFGFKMMGRVQD